MSFEDIFTDHWLPAKPLCADRKNGSYKRQTRARALEHAYIETNPLAMQSLIVTDHDGADADYIADLAGLPQPSWVAMNPHTRSGHIVYALEAPVCLTDAGHRAPVNLLARVEQGLTDVLGGDIGYGGRITKGGQECRPLQPHPPVGLQGAFTLHGLHGVVRDGVRLCFDEECFGDC